jgi:hypothetical protein
MKLAMTGGFSEGEYRLAVVRNALTAPELLLFGPRRRRGLDVRTHVQMHPHHRAACRPLSRPVSQQLICSPCAGREVDMVVTGTCASHGGTGLASARVPIVNVRARPSTGLFSATRLY